MLLNAMEVVRFFFCFNLQNIFQNNLDNAKYAITAGRKIGAKIYALPEDIVEVEEI